jgi:peptidoglycan hydrolase FlgJ
MSISINTDLVLDVVKASTPDRTRMAQLKLGGDRLNTGIVSKFQEFLGGRMFASTHVRDLPADLVGDVVNSADKNRMSAATEKLGGAEALVASNNLGMGDAANVKNSDKQNQQFEAMILRSFVEEMMPKATPSLYGEGTAGEIWRSMQSDYMSQEIAKSGGVGIAKMLSSKENPKVVDSSGAAMNRIVGNFGHDQPSIATASEWPYFQMSKMGGQQI